MFTTAVLDALWQQKSVFTLSELSTFKLVCSEHISNVEINKL